MDKYKDKWFFELLDSIKTQCEKEKLDFKIVAKFLGLNEKSIELYGKSAEQLDAFPDSSVDDSGSVSSTNFFSHIDIKNAPDLLLKKVTDFSIDKSYEAIRGEDYQLWIKANKLYPTQAALAEAAGKTESQITEFKNSVVRGEEPKSRTLEAVKKAINEKQSTTDEGVQAYIQSVSQIDDLNDNQKNNLCGHFLFIRRSHYDVNQSAEDRKVLLSNFKIYLERDNLFFKYLNWDEECGFNLVKGFVFRETEKSIRFVSISNTIVTLSFSVDLSIKLKNPNQLFLNGGIFFHNQDKKPYHTWCHLSKITSLDKNIHFNNFIEALKKENIGSYVIDEYLSIFKAAEISQFLEPGFFEKLSPFIQHNYVNEEDSFFKRRIVKKLGLKLDSIEEYNNHVIKFL